MNWLRRFKLLLVGQVHNIDYYDVIGIFDKIGEKSTKDELAKVMDVFCTLEAIAEVVSASTGVWVRYHSQHGFMVITENNTEFIQWKLTWL